MMPSSSSSAATSSASNSHEPPTMRQPFVLTQEAIRNAGLHILTPHQLNCAVIVYDLSDDVSIKQLNEFFTFCGGVEKIILNQNQREQLFAVVVLEDEAAFSTAVLLNQAILNDQTISVVSYREFIGHGSSSSSSSSQYQHTNRNSSNSSKQSYLEHLQEKQSAYDKAISLIAMGYVKSQQALDEMKEKSKELDEQTKDLRQQIAESTQPIVSTTKMTWESTTQKLQPMLGAAREKTAQVTAPVLHTTKEKVGEMKERINNSQVWENETVKQGIAATNAAKEGLYTAGQGAWTAIKTSWFSFASDVKTESTQLKGDETLENAQQGSSSTDAPPPTATSGEQEEEEQPVDNYFQFTPASSENNNDLLDVSENVSNENNEPSTSYTLGVDEDGDEYGVVATSPATPN